MPEPAIKCDADHALDDPDARPVRIFA